MQYVVHDADVTLWKTLGVDDWPAVAITASGKNSGAQHALFAALGERASASELVQQATALTIEHYSKRGAAGVQAQLRPIPALPPSPAAGAGLLQEPSGNGSQLKSILHDILPAREHKP